MRHIATTICTMAVLAASQAIGAESRLQIVLELDGDAERRVVNYECEDDSGLRTVEYINAHPNFLAITEVEGERLIFVTAISASGVRYVSGAYVWWTKGPEAFFYDETAGEDAEPVTCIEATNTP